MHRFFLPPEKCRDSVLVLDGAEAHHAVRVLRLRRGDLATVLDGAGREFRCEVAEVARERIGLRVKETVTAPPRDCEVTLFQAIAKGKLFEFIIQKATELGVARIVPLVTERVVAEPASKDAQRKASKWRGVAIEAIKQCGSPWLPEVVQPMTPHQVLARSEAFEVPLVASLQPGSRHVRHWFQNANQRLGRAPRTVCLWIGPEGDFTPEEVSMLVGSGVLPISLGPLVLRCDTAAISSLAIINSEVSAPAE